jgi:acetyl-CoA acetyltransferase family protein
VSSYILDAVRSPLGKFSKGLADVRPDDLAAEVMATLMERNQAFEPGHLDEIILGGANQAGEDNRNVARMAGLLAGFPTTVPGVTVNRLCASGLESTVQASRAIESGDHGLVIAGGVESMSRAPWVLPKPDRGFPAGNQTLWSSTLGWRMTNPQMDQRWTIHNGESAEILADKFGLSREEQDDFAARSHRLAHAAWDSGIFESEVAKLRSSELERDEGIRPDTSRETLAALKPAFRAEGGTVTAGNSSQLSDGAAMLLIGGEAQAAHVDPMCRILSRAVVGNDPDIFGVAPVEAANIALQRAGKTWADVDVVELNEAFASQSLACLAGWPDLDPERVNIHGGAIALGHPLGASGARILGHLAHELVRRGSGVGVAAICIGVGQGLAVVVER